MQLALARRTLSKQLEHNQKPPKHPEPYLLRAFRLGKPTPPKRIPDEAIYMIRFHSFYPWHSPKGQGQLAV